MYVTEAELRELWRDGKASLPTFPAGTRFSPSAHDFLKAHNLEIHFDSAPTADLPPLTSQLPPPTWDRPGAFPVVLTGSTPVCAVCGSPLPHKPGHMTQIDPGHYAPKTSPRLRLRGRLDSLHAAFLIAIAHGRRFQQPDLAAHLSTLAAYCREITSAEYHTRPVAPLQLAGHDEDLIHEISHWPDKHLGLAHIVPGPDDHDILLWLNFVRTLTRETELDALDAFAGPEPGATSLRPDLAHALNRLSSAVYYLELLFKAGKLTWKLPG